MVPAVMTIIKMSRARQVEPVAGVAAIGYSETAKNSTSILHDKLHTLLIAITYATH